MTIVQRAPTAILLLLLCAAYTTGFIRGPIHTMHRPSAPRSDLTAKAFNLDGQGIDLSALTHTSLTSLTSHISHISSLPSSLAIATDLSEQLQAYVTAPVPDVPMIGPISVKDLQGMLYALLNPLYLWCMCVLNPPFIY
jgi:hypothetical protein